MAFGQKKEKPKAPTFYLKPNDKGFAGKVGEDEAQLKITKTGRAVLEINGGKDKGGSEFWGNPKENQYGAFYLFIIEGHFWYGKGMTTKFGDTFQLKQGGKAEDSAEWLAKQVARGSSAADASFEGGAGAAGIAAPAGQPAGVQIKAGSAVASGPAVVSGTAPRPPKPRGYKPQSGQ